MKKIILCCLLIISSISYSYGQFGRSEEEILRDYKISTNNYLEKELYEQFQPHLRNKDEATIDNVFLYSTSYTRVEDLQYSKLEKKARKGNVKAQFQLWQLAESGDYDYDKGERWLKIAAENGHQEALEILGFMATMGLGMDEYESLYWLLVGSRYCHPGCLNTLAARYELGEGVKKDLAMAKILYKESSKRGNELARESLKRLN